MPVEPAFVKALRAHIDSLSPEQQRVFNDASQLTSQNLLRKVRELDETHKDHSIARHDKLRDFLDLLKQGLGSLSTVIGGVSSIVSLVQGVVKLVVEVCPRVEVTSSHITNHFNSSPYAFSRSLQS